jgi:hypothetical protein
MSENGPQRSRPFVLLTGTPGTGKTTTASLVAVRGKTDNWFVDGSNFWQQVCKYENETTKTDLLILFPFHSFSHLLDAYITLPGTHGYETCQRWRSD